MVKLIVGVNDLLTTHRDLCKEWHPTKNEGLSPTDVTFGSHKKVWWIGKCGHEWQAVVKNRANGIGCPICSGKQVLKGFNDLESLFPNIAKEWHPTKNGNLCPSNVTAYNSRKVWWIDKDGFEWQARINHRTLRGSNAPKMPNHKPLVGINDLATIHPELLKEWHPTKNGSLKITDCSSGSDKKVWWLCPKGHEHLTSISHHVSRGGCPICNKERGTSFPEQAILYYFSLHTNAKSRYKFNNVEIDIYLSALNIGIEYDGLAFHCGVDAQKKESYKNKVLLENGIKLIRVKESKIRNLKIEKDVIFYCPNSDYSNLNDVIRILFSYVHLKLEQTVNINRDRINIYNQYLSIEKQNSIATKYPELLKEWNYSKNGYLNPEYFSYSSNHKVWWKCSKGHEWLSSISHRASGKGCPYCSNRLVLKGFNDLLTTNPSLASQWHPTKNGNLKPTDVSAGEKRKVWWKCEHGHEWNAALYSRNQGYGCPFCTGRLLIKGVNDLATLYPNLCEEFDIEKNGINPNDVFSGGTKKYWWKCKQCGHTWQATIYNRAIIGSGCHKCWRKKVGSKLGTKVVLIEKEKIFSSMTEAEKYIGFPNARKRIKECCDGTRESYKGYHWKYKE